MVYFRSFLAGLAATIIAEILLNIAVIAVLSMTAKQAPNSGFLFVGWNPALFARTAPGWIILVLAFAAGYSWQYRRLRRAIHS